MFLSLTENDSKFRIQGEKFKGIFGQSRNYEVNVYSIL